jgi:hypothetical protein
MTPLPRYLVTLDTPEGEWKLEIASFQGAEAAGRRAHIALVHKMHYLDDRYDLDTVHVKNVEEIAA